MHRHTRVQILLAGQMLRSETWRIHTLHHQRLLQGKHTERRRQAVSVSAAQVSGDEQVLKEIVARGPVACRVCDSKSFLSYTGGIFSDEKAYPCRTVSKKHVVLSGWGEENGVRFWIGRNSWGTYWGEMGWFRVAMGKGDMGISTDCYAAVPKPPKYHHLYQQNRISGIARIKKEFRNQDRSESSSFLV